MNIFNACSDVFSGMFAADSIVRMAATVSILLMACCAARAGQTYYVATNGDDKNPGTEAKPFKTVQQAVTGLKPGDTVLIRAGRYPMFTVHNLRGTAEAPITFKSYPGEKATIDRGLDGPDVAWTIHILGHCCYLTFEDLEVTDSDPLIDTLRKLDVRKPEDLAEFVKHLDSIKYRDGVRINPPGEGEPHHHLIFRNLEVHHCIGLGFSGKGHDLQFINNHVYDLGRPRSGYGWYTSGDNHVYRGNLVHDCSYGFHLYGGPLHNAIVENNIVYNCGGPFYHMSSQKVHEGGSGILFWPEEGDKPVDGNNVIRNNVLYGNHTGLNVQSQGMLVVNNTLYGSLKTGLFTFADKGMILRDNIIYKSGNTDVEETAGNTYDHNLVGVDPLFVNAGAHDFRLQPNSPAIDAGVPIPGFDVDIDGVKRPQEKAWDIGAYEAKAQ